MRQLFNLLKDDLFFYSEGKVHRFLIYFLFDRRFHLISIYRIGAKFEQIVFLKPLNILLRYLMGLLFSCDISFRATIGKSLDFPHPIGIVICEGVKNSDNIRIFQHVTIGSHGKFGEGKKYPVIEDNVTIFANSSIIGGVLVRKNSTIGAHSLVLGDVEENAIYAGSPAIKIKQN